MSDDVEGTYADRSLPFATRIERIPGEDGFDKPSSQDKYLRVACELHERGIDRDAVVEMLHDLYWAAASCYGA